MKVTAERLPESRVLLEIEVDNERLEKAMNQAYRRVVGKARIPGFRPGKAPRAMVERYLGHGTLLQEALDHLVPEVYEEAVKQEGLEPIDQPDLEMPQLEPPIVKATVPVRPTIDLGDYRALRLEPETVTVEEHLIDDAVEDLRHRYATVEPVERPVRLADLVRVDLKTTADDEVYFDHKDAEFPVTVDDTANLPGLAEGMVGMAKGETKEFSIDVPEDATRTTLAGKKITYSVTLHEIKQENLPVLNDEFASQAGEGFPTMEALRAKLYADARQRLEDEAKRRYEEKAVDALVEGATFEYPPVLVEREIDRMIREQTMLGGQQQAMQRYLATIGKTEAEYREGFREEAIERVRRSLALSQFTDDEGISVGEDEVSADIDRMIGDAGESGERLRELFGGESGRGVLERSLLTRKAHDRLADIALGKPVPERPVAKAAEAAVVDAVASAVESDAEAAEPANADQSADATTEAAEDRPEQPEVPAPAAQQSP